MSPAASFKRRLASRSRLPSAFRQPMTTPSTPSSRHIRMSSSIRSTSRGVYRKSPPRGRIITCRRVLVSRRRATLISPYEGVVPHSGIPAHNSTRLAPPSWAAKQLSTPLAHTSNWYVFDSFCIVGRFLFTKVHNYIEYGKYFE